MATARRHHYLPVSYLAGFTPSGGRSDSLFVFDRHTKEVRRAKPKAVAFETDLYAVNAPGIPQDAFERLLASTQDDRAARALQHVCCAGSLPEAELNTLLDFMSLLVVRSPRFCLEMAPQVREQTGGDLAQAVEDPGTWHWLSEYLDQTQPNREYLRLIAQSLGCGEYPRLSPEDVAARVSCRLTSAGDKSQFWRVAIMWPCYQILAAELKRKAWSLCFADDTASFICSDSPVGVAWTEDWVAERDPKYADESAVVTFPLDRHMAIVAGLHAARHIPREAVAQVNSLTGRRAVRFLFSSSSSSPIALSDGTIATVGDVLLLGRGQDGESGPSLS